MSLMNKEVWKLVQDVIYIRGISLEDFLSRSREKKLTCARRAVCFILQDKYGLKNKVGNAMTWTELGQILNKSRSGLYESTHAWPQKEGSQDPSFEEQFRSLGYFGHKHQKNIHDMAVEQGKKCKTGLGYWSNITSN